jgi:hypothetical protein
MAINPLNHDMALSVDNQNHVKNAEILSVKGGGIYNDHWAANSLINLLTIKLRSFKDKRSHCNEVFLVTVR